MEGLANIEKALTAIRDANASYPASMIVQTFVNTKRDEIINIFMVADLKTRRRIYDIMKLIVHLCEENHMMFTKLVPFSDSEGYTLLIMMKDQDLEHIQVGLSHNTSIIPTVSMYEKFHSNSVDLAGSAKMRIQNYLQ
jgi:hypothetical protein